MHTYRDDVLSVCFGKIQRENKYKYIYIIYILMQKNLLFPFRFDMSVQLGENTERAMNV